jgi:hypothetical protein
MTDRGCHCAKMPINLILQNLLGSMKEVLGSEIEQNQKDYQQHQGDAYLRLVIKTEQVSAFQVPPLSITGQ